MAYFGAELKTVKTIAKRLKENWKCSIKNNDNNKKNKHLILEKWQGFAKTFSEKGQKLPFYKIAAYSTFGSAALRFKMNCTDPWYLGNQS